MFMSLTKNGWTDCDAVWGGWLGRARATIIRCGSRSPMGRGNFGGCLARLTASWVIVALCAAKRSVTASQRHCCSRLQCCKLFGVTLNCPAWKICFVRCGFSSNCFDHLFQRRSCGIIFAVCSTNSVKELASARENHSLTSCFLVPATDCWNEGISLSLYSNCVMPVPSEKLSVCCYQRRHSRLCG